MVPPYSTCCGYLVARIHIHLFLLLNVLPSFFFAWVLPSIDFSCTGITNSFGLRLFAGMPALLLALVRRGLWVKQAEPHPYFSKTPPNRLPPAMADPILSGVAAAIAAEATVADGLQTLP